MFIFADRIGSKSLERLREKLVDSTIPFRELRVCEGLFILVDDIGLDEIKKEFSSIIIHENREYNLVLRRDFCKSLKIDFGSDSIGGGEFQFIAGPCAVESEEMLSDVAKFLLSLGVRFLRGSIFKPRTSPYTFQGLGESGIEILKRVKEKYNMKVVVEPLSSKNVEMLLDVADIFQIGSRNMQNFALLRDVGESKKAVILKRGMSATLREFLLAAEHILYRGNEKVILCERGIRTFSDFSRNTLDLSIIPALKRETYLPVIVDPSHGTGRRDIVMHMVFASIVSGADGILLEIHPDPSSALSDGAQSLSIDEFKTLHEKSLKLLSFYKSYLI